MGFNTLRKHLSQFPPEVLLDKSVEGLLEKAALHEFTGGVFGASGGIDSLVSAALCLKAREKNDRWRVVGLQMNDSRVKGEHHNAKLYKALGVELVQIDITNQAREEEKLRGMPPRWRAEWLMSLVLRRLPAILRRRVILRVKAGAVPQQALLYYQLFTLLHQLRIARLNKYAASQKLMRIICANRSEALLGYFVEQGIDDPALGDYAPLLGLYKTEVMAVAHCLGLPLRVIRQRPSPGFGGIYDEEIIGPYELVDQVLVGLELGYSDRELTKALEPLGSARSRKKTCRRGGPFDIHYVSFLRELRQLNTGKQGV